MDGDDFWDIVEKCVNFLGIIITKAIDFLFGIVDAIVMSLGMILILIGKWLHRKLIGKPCYYCKIRTSSWQKNVDIGTENSSYIDAKRMAFCKSSECTKQSEEHAAEIRRIAIHERQQFAAMLAADEIRRAEEQAAREKAAAEAKAASEKAAAEAKAASEKAAAEAKAASEKAAAEKAAMEKRESEAVGMVNAGIPEEIVELWVSDELEKGDMFFMLQTFNEDFSKWSTELINIVQKSDIPRFFTDDIKQNVTMLKSLISDHKSEMVKFTFQKHSQFDEQALKFLQKCQTEEHLYPLYLEILERDFDIEFAYKLVNDFGFNEHSDALKEVIAGANWEAVAVKYGFLQYD